MQDPDVPSALATIIDPATIAHSLMAVASIGKRCQLSSFDPRTPNGASMLVQATILDCIPLKDVIGKTIGVCDYYVHDAGRTDDNGECEEWTRIVIFADDGKAYSCGARGVAKSLAVIAYARNQASFSPPVKCEVKLKQLGNGKQWLSLIPDLASLGVTTASGKPPKPRQ